LLKNDHDCFIPTIPLGRMKEKGNAMSDIIEDSKTIEKYGKVLVIDDELALVQNIQDMLEAKSIGFMPAENAQQALELLGTEKFDVIFCDIQMPKMNGLQFLESIRHQGNPVPVVFFSGFYEKEMLQQAMKLGAYEFLEKPLAEEQLIQTVERATEYGLLQRKIAGIAEVKDPKVKKSLNEYQNKIKQLRVTKFAALQSERKLG
jgi:DNA-binding NtrC family response regulator